VGGDSTTGGGAVRLSSSASAVSFSTYSSPSIVPARVWASTTQSSVDSLDQGLGPGSASVIDGTGSASGIGAPFRVRSPLLVASVAQVAAGGGSPALVSLCFWGGASNSCGWVGPGGWVGGWVGGEVDCVS
jgi:hypothetical protein